MKKSERNEMKISIKCSLCEIMLAIQKPHAVHQLQFAHDWFRITANFFFFLKQD